MNQSEREICEQFWRECRAQILVSTYTTEQLKQNYRQAQANEAKWGPDLTFRDARRIATMALIQKIGRLAMREYEQKAEA